MPGLFGMVRVAPEADRPRDSRGIFRRMAALLVHTQDDVLWSWEKSDEFLIGRIGATHLHTSPWPTDLQGASQRFVAGVLHTSKDQALRTAASAPISPSSLSALRGFYAFAEHHLRGRFTLAADRRASIPVYYAEIDGYLLFAPEVRALLAHPRLTPTLDPGAIALLLASGHMIADQTLLSSVRRLPGGHALTVDHGRCERLTYWRYRPGSRVGPESEEELELELGRLVREAARRNLGDLNKTVIFLSGGADSRGILGAALETVDGVGARLNTVTWGVSERVPGSDAAIAGSIASTTGVRHRFMKRTIKNYEAHFERANALIGSASDVVAYHPLEYSFMRNLRMDGFERVLRGDEALGWSSPVSSIAAAVKKVKLHRLGDDARLRNYVRTPFHDEWCRASDAIVTSVEEEVRGAAPDEAKDYLYFAHRLEGYLNTASYYKLIWLDQRNVLLDEDILDFFQVVPAALRADKLLYRRAMARAFPQLWASPFASVSSLENWRDVLANDTEVRRYIRKSLDDTRSHVWEFFDRRALSQLFESTSPALAGRSIRARAASSLRAMLHRLPNPVVEGMQRFRSSHVALHLPAHSILLRVLVVKQFVDEIRPLPGYLAPRS